MDKETFDCEEYSSIPEMQYFSAERFKVNEALNFSLESYNAPEIAKQQESKNTSSAEGIDISYLRVVIGQEEKTNIKMSKKDVNVANQFVEEQKELFKTLGGEQNNTSN